MDRERKAVKSQQNPLPHLDKTLKHSAAPRAEIGDLAKLEHQVPAYATGYYPYPYLMYDPISHSQYMVSPGYFPNKTLPNAIYSNSIPNYFHPYSAGRGREPSQTLTHILAPPVSSHKNHPLEKQNFAPSMHNFQRATNKLPSLQNKEDLILLNKHQQTKRKACSTCRVKKRRCDLLTPCGSCMKKGVHCQYDNLEKDMLVELTELKEENEGLKTIILHLEEKLKKLESKLHNKKQES